MDVITLGPGEYAPEDKDRIHLNELPDGRTGYSGSVVIYPNPPGKPFTVNIVAENVLPTKGQVVDAGIAWAENYGATEL